MEIVQLDLNKYLQKHLFPSRTVLVFPPFNGFRRFLIHKLIEDNFSSSGVAAFSIGQDISRRIVVCYKGLIRDIPNKANLAASSLPRAGVTMIEKEKQSRQKLTPTAAVYRPPAARIAESRRNTDDSNRSSDTKRNRVRRPDQQMYVPRPKRASYGNEQPRSRSQSSSRTSLECDSSDRRNRCSPLKFGESRFSDSTETINSTSDLSKTGTIVGVNDCREKSFETDKNVPTCSFNASSFIPTGKDATVEENNTTVNNTKINSMPAEVHDERSTPSILSNEVLNENSIVLPYTSDVSSNVTVNDVTKDNLQGIPKSEVGLENSRKIPVILKTEVTIKEQTSTQLQIEDNSTNSSESSSESKEAEIDKKLHSSKPEPMETISISSDSRGDQSSNSFTSSNTDSRSSDSSNDSEVPQRNSHKSTEKMEVDLSSNCKKKEDCINDRDNNSQEQNLKNRRIFPSLPVSDVLIISDSSSSYDGPNTQEKCDSNLDDVKKAAIRKPQEPKEKDVKKTKSVDPDNCDWETLYDDSGECLVPTLIEELTNSVGRVRVTSADSDYRPYQTVEERTNDGECVIEIYDFPAEFKTTDLFNIFAAYRNKNFQIKWVDDTHALGVFPSPLMADEVLACTLPYVKTRPLRLGTAESRNKARNLVLPPLPSMERPKTCTALARRLVSGALGLRIPTSSQEREMEKQVLKEAREKRRLEAKQREAAWDGTLTSNSCI